MTGTPLTHDFGFAAHHIPGLAPAEGALPMLEPVVPLEPVAVGVVAADVVAGFVTAAPVGDTPEVDRSTAR